MIFFHFKILVSKFYK